MTDVQLLGWVIDGKRGVVRPAPRRAWRARLSIDYTLRRRRMRVRDVQKVLGHLAFLALLSRESLASFSSIYKWIASAKIVDDVLGLCPSALRELKMFKGVIPLLTRNLRAPWSTSVHCTDALPIGYAVSQTHVSTEVISKVARVHDRCFFSQSQEVSLRQRALTAYQQFREHDPDVPSELFETGVVVPPESWYMLLGRFVLPKKSKTSITLLLQKLAPWHGLFAIN